MKLLSILLILVTSSPIWASSDSLSLDYPNFIKIVLANHPISKQSDLQLEVGKQSVKSSKGAFDPEIKVGYDQKSFDGMNYYQINKNELQLNSRFGVQFRGGYEQNTGEFLNPESNVPTTGLAYAGLTVPLGSGLLMDERRYVLNQAELFMQATKIEQQQMINSLVVKATMDYWSWYMSWQAHEVYLNAVDLAEVRFLGIKERFRQGDAPAIDTLESFILLQNRIVGLTEAYGKLQKSKAALSNYFWTDEQQPLELAEQVIPSDQEKDGNSTSITEERFIELVDSSIENHPELAMYENKLASLDLSRRMAVEKLKPKLNVSYNFLVEPVQGGNPEVFSSNNYKWGIQFGMPLFLRESRGKLALTKVKINQVDLEVKTTRQKIYNRVDGIFNELNATKNQLLIYRRVVENYQGLLEGERQKFIGGESSVFLINSRENSLIEAEIKLYDLFAKLKQKEVELAYALGDVLILL